jgi:hypothetical protein
VALFSRMIYERNTLAATSHVTTFAQPLGYFYSLLEARQNMKVFAFEPEVQTTSRWSAMCV